MLKPSGPPNLQPRTHERLDYSQEYLWSEAFAHLGVAVAQLALGGKLLTVNDRLCELIGYQKRDLLGKDFREIFQPGESQSECETFFSRLAAGEICRYSTVSSARRSDGAIVWFNLVFSLVRGATTHTPRSLTLVAKDITSLKQTSQELRDAELARDNLSRRMMGAQDADRTRIARELHDDIGQSLAILKIQMLRAGQPVSGHPEMTHVPVAGPRFGRLPTSTQRYRD